MAANRIHPPATRSAVLAELIAGGPVPDVAAKFGVPQTTVRDWQRAARTGRAGGGTAKEGTTPLPTETAGPSRVVGLPHPDPIAGGPSLPEAEAPNYAPYLADTAGNWGVLSDAHIPFHDLPTIRGWIDDCKRSGVVGLLLNGDILDCYQVSDHVRDPSAPRMKDEIEKGRQFIEYLRATFPRARICWRTGNHEDRLARYLATRAPEIFDLPDVHLRALLHVDQHGVEWVQDKRVVMLGKLPVLHGHEYAGGGGVMPARWLFLRTGESAMTGHFHQPTFYSFRTVRDKEVGMWSLGCACHLAPAYRPLNQWGHGWAITEVASDGGFYVHNRRLLRSGKVA